MGDWIKWTNYTDGTDIVSVEKRENEMKLTVSEIWEILFSIDETTASRISDDFLEKLAAQLNSYFDNSIEEIGEVVDSGDFVEVILDEDAQWTPGEKVYRRISEEG